MSDPEGHKGASIPQWQQSKNNTASGTPGEVTLSSDDPKPTSTDSSASRARLLEQASKFLQEDEIKDAPREKKIAFLESKGLDPEDVQSLVDPPSDRSSAETEKEAGKETSVRTHRHGGELSRKSAEDSQPSPSTAPIPQPVKSAPTSSTEPVPPKDIPPIITYPEFLLHSRKPPPIVTTSNLINTFYLFSAAAATVYGTSKYIVDPMLESLTSARHDLFETARKDLNTLAEKLEKNVSKIPNGTKKAGEDEVDDADDNDSDSAEDMAPLFNRTIGTQTSPPLSPSASSTEAQGTPAIDTITAHDASLKSLQAALSSFLPPAENQDATTTTTVADVRSKLDDLERYLLDLPKPSTFLARDAASKEDAAFNSFKADIRSVKGALLSARNFPSGTARAG